METILPLSKYRVSRSFNYVAAFLTLRCTFGCSYCINKHHEFNVGSDMSGEDWVRGLSRLQLRKDLPITLQGGEPSTHPDCWRIASRLYSRGYSVDILTNGDFDISAFVKCVPEYVFKREAKYASIRFSYHPEVHDGHALASKVWTLQECGYSVGIWGLEHPEYSEYNERMRKVCRTYRVDFRMKEFLGEHNGKFYGTIKYPGACSQYHKRVSCKTSELLIGPSGHIYRCHSDLYAGRGAIGHLLDESLEGCGIGTWKECVHFGGCSVCDVKVKTNRHQVYGHTSVEIKREMKRCRG